MGLVLALGFIGLGFAVGFVPALITAACIFVVLVLLGV